jgi:hypothetical protein
MNDDYGDGFATATKLWLGLIFLYAGLRLNGIPLP